MNIKPDKIRTLILKIDQLIDHVMKAELRYSGKTQQVHPSFEKSAKNLIHYRALRSIDITDLQKSLGQLGLSRLVRAEPHILASLINSKFILSKLIDGDLVKDVKKKVSLKKSQKLIKTHTKKLLGYRSKGRRVRIMVTLPTEAAQNYDLVYHLIERGMNTARINCAHDRPNDWKKMIDHVYRAKKQLKKDCRICMDLAGPKIRTGTIEAGPEVRRFKPLRNEFGQTIELGLVVLVPELNIDVANEIPVDEGWINKLKKGDKITFTDARDKKRILTVDSLENEKAIATCSDTFYVRTGTKLTISRTDQNCEVKKLPAIEQSLLLKIGDTLRITKDQIDGRPIQYSEKGEPLTDAYISCTSEVVFDFVKVGEKILFDDGKIEGHIKSVNTDEIEVEIIRAKLNGSKLKSDKGINLPYSDLRISGLTEKDKEDMKFVAKYADVVNFSFVNSPEDVDELLREMEKYGVLNKLGIIMKIETKRAFNNLTDIILAGMKNYPLGVMIARGDLAIESGWESIARVQQEILSLCNAAHIPDVWATQVLENLAKKGIPSRSEITDVATSLGAECVMLNKGPFILKAVTLLDYILRSMSWYQDKNIKMTPAMENADFTLN